MSDDPPKAADDGTEAIKARRTGFEGLTPDLAETFAFIGVLTMMVQLADTMINACLKYIWPDKLDFSVESLIPPDDDSERLTLGQLLAALRDRLIIAEDFDEYLRSFLEMRNEFTHRMTSIDGFAQFSTPEGKAKIKAYCEEFGRRTAIVMSIFVMVLGSEGRRILEGQMEENNESAKILSRFFVPKKRTQRLARRRIEILNQRKNAKPN